MQGGADGELYGSAMTKKIRGESLVLTRRTSLRIVGRLTRVVVGVPREGSITIQRAREDGTMERQRRL